MTISTNVLAITGAFGGGRGTGGSPPKDEEFFKKWLDRLADALKRLAGKAVKVLHAIAGSAVGAMQRVKKVQVFASACIIRSFVFLARPDIFNTPLRYLVSYNARYDNSWPS